MLLLFDRLRGRRPGLVRGARGDGVENRPLGARSRCALASGDPHGEPFIGWAAKAGSHKVVGSEVCVVWAPDRRFSQLPTVLTSCRRVVVPRAKRNVITMAA